MNDAHILECYRTTLLQLPPNIYLTSTTMSRFQQTRRQFAPEQLDLLHAVKVCMTPSGTPNESGKFPDGIYVLATLLVLACHAVPSKNMLANIYCPGKKATFELALNRWLSLQSSHPDDSALVLFHLGFVVLHTNMPDIHNLVRDFTHRKSQPATVSSEVIQWRRSDNCDVAILHATQLVETAKRLSLRAESRPAGHRSATKPRSFAARHDETPHAAICVYLAIITLWAAEIASESVNLHNAKASLSGGCNILRRFRLRIAAGLEKILRYLDENTD